MAIALLSVNVRHERRLRLLFTNVLAAGAFGVPGPAYYTVENLDGKAVSPVVEAALIVSGSPEVVELSLGADLCNGAMYRITADGVPATDASTTPSGSQEQFRFGTAPTKTKVEPGLRDRERLLFQVDLIWNGSDYEESPTGDLARVEGVPNVTKALWRRVETPGLPWDPTWGVDVREYVDSPSALAVPLRGVVAGQVAQDPRVSSVKTAVEIQQEKTFIHITPTLKGGTSSEPVSVTVPNDS